MTDAVRDSYDARAKECANLFIDDLDRVADTKNKPRIRSAREYRICRIGLQRLARLGRGKTPLSPHSGKWSETSNAGGGAGASGGARTGSPRHSKIRRATAGSWIATRRCVFLQQRGIPERRLRRPAAAAPTTQGVDGVRACAAGLRARNDRQSA